MRRAVKALLQRLGGALGIYQVRADLDRIAADTAAGVRAGQLALRLQYQEILRRRGRLPTFADVELRYFSQNGEDGILLFIFALLDGASRRSVEIGAGDGRQCNTANLIIHHGWNGLLLERDARAAADGRAFFAAHPDTCVHPPTFVHAHVTRENVDELIASHGFAGEVDLLSIDVDGVDYWIWEAITCIRPRVVVVEVQVIWADARAVTVPYSPDFTPQMVDGFGAYSGASLPALVALGRAKGYRLIGSQQYGFNAFFMRNDVGADLFPEACASDCLRHPFVAWARDRLLPLVQDREWIEV